MKLSFILLHSLTGIEKHMVFSTNIHWKRLPTRHVNFDPNVLKSLPETNLTLEWYTHSYRYFNHCNHELYQMMQLKDSLLKKANDFINQCKGEFMKEHPKVSFLNSLAID